MNEDLWKLENYSAFLDARRELLANAANEFLDNLFQGAVSEGVVAPVLERPVIAFTSEDEGEDEERILRECNQWVVEQGLPEGEFMYELVNPESGEAVAILDLAWANGLQEGYSQPVALLIDEPTEVEEAVNRAGFRFFMDVGSFREYVTREILAISGVQ